MRIWDIHPGYLNQSSLLAEHRELDALVAILQSATKKNSQDREVKRWIGYGWAIKQRHKQVVCEMALRGYENSSVVRLRANKGIWPTTYIDKPDVQLTLLKEQYQFEQAGRITLPKNPQALWSHYKYSVLARDPNRYKEFGKRLATQSVGFEQLALELVELLRTQPSKGGIRNALQHMWGHVSHVSEHKGNIDSWSLHRLLLLTQENVRQSNEPYLTNSTALSDLMVWL
jgi:uncharacterized protein YbgA (DUF1722 family)